MENISVSIILSVYNTEKYLKKCLNSLIEQTLDTIEIIAVNNGSTDNCGIILEDYRSSYPEKFHVITLQKNTGDPAEPWNIGISAAKGKYISIVDSDDWCDLSMFYKLYTSAQKYDADIVLCDHCEILSKNDSIRSKINANQGPLPLKDFMLNPHMAPWGKIVKRDIYIKNNLKYKSQIHCDTGLNLIMYSFVEKVVYEDDVLYYYNRLNPNSETNTKKRMRQATVVDTLDHILLNCNKKWEEEIVFDVVRFLYWFSFTEYFFHQDIFIPFILKHKKKILNNRYLRSNKEGLRVVFDYLKMDMVPKRIIYSSFGKTALTEIEKQCISSWSKYTQNYEIIQLDESNCDISKNQYIAELYKDGDIEKVSTYFLLKYLYEQGGIILDTHMMMNAPIGELRMHNLTVGYDSLTSIGNAVIAAKPHNPVIKKICEDILLENEFKYEHTVEDIDDIIFSTEEDQSCSSFSRYFQDYLLGYSYRFSNQNAIVQNDILILSSDRLYYNINQNNLFYRVYPDIYQICDKPFIALHQNAIRSFTNYVNNLEAHCHALEAEVRRVKNSRSWRYLAPVRRFMRFLREIRGKMTFNK